MKIARQVTLHFREGNSDKVYEIDLCEVGPDRFVVNFRFGRRGSALKDGSKTPLPVTRAEAEGAFDALMREKVGKGYRAVDPAALAAADEPRPAVRVEDVADPRHQRIVALLQGARGGWTSDPEKLVWRAGELRVRAAVPLIVPLLGSGTDRRSWNAARALLRCGDPAAVPALRQLHDRSTGHVRSMAAHALVTLSPDPRPLQASWEAALPAAVRAALDGPDLPALLTACAADPELPDVLYRVGVPHLPALLAALPMGRFLGIRRVYQASEARADGEIFGVVAKRFETERAAVGRVPHGRQRKAGHAQGWSAATRTWFRRRAWRTLHRLGSAGMDAEYCRLAAGLLLAYTDADGGSPELPVERIFTAINPRTGARIEVPGKTRARPGRPLEAHWAFGQVLWAESRRFVANPSKLTRKPVFRAPTEPRREEAFPELWDAHPELLADLLDRGRCAQVHAFAATALRANRAGWVRIPVASLLGWFASPYADTAQLATEVAIARYDARSPDLALVRALLSCAHPTARAQAAAWVRATPAPFLRDLDFLVALVLNPEPDTRRLALEVIGAATLPAALGAALVDRVVAAALASPADADPATLRDAAAVLVTALSAELRSLPLAQVAALVSHPSAGASELGAKALLGHTIRPPDLPDDLLAALVTSPHAVTRGIGIRLYGELPDHVLAERFRVLVAMVTHALPDVRLAVRPIVARLGNGNPGFARVLLAALVPILAADGPDGMHADVVSLLRTELAPLLARFDEAAIFRLIKATETVVQELGGDLLRQNLDPRALSVGRLADLASSDVLAVRRSAWAILRARVDDVRAAPEAVPALLDARWEDSRAFAARFVEDEVGPDRLPPDVVVAVCDSVRPDVQAFGRRLVTRLFEATDGPIYLEKLAQHPSPAMQAFASAWLDAHAAGHPDRLERLVPFFERVLGRPNTGRVAKARVYAFLAREAGRDEASARLVVGVLEARAGSLVRGDRERAIAILADVRRRFPTIPTRLVERPPEVRGAV